MIRKEGAVALANVKNTLTFDFGDYGGGFHIFFNGALVAYQLYHLAPPPQTLHVCMERASYHRIFGIYRLIFIQSLQMLWHFENFS
jgi:hypothetical protein